MEDSEDTVLAVELELVRLIKGSEDVFELEGLDVWNL